MRRARNQLLSAISPVIGPPFFLGGTMAGAHLYSSQAMYHSLDLHDNVATSKPQGTRVASYLAVGALATMLAFISHQYLNVPARHTTIAQATLGPLVDCHALPSETQPCTTPLPKWRHQERGGVQGASQERQAVKCGQHRMAHMWDGYRRHHLCRCNYCAGVTNYDSSKTIFTQNT